jgi:hypothetical protein
MQYTVRNRRRLRPTTGEHVRATMPQPAAEPAQLAEGSGLHRRPLVTEINLTIPFQGRVR